MGSPARRCCSAWAAPKAGEPVTSGSGRPDGSVFMGSPHPASQDGAVTTKYNTSGDAPGTYKVVATGDRGTSLQASYRLLGEARFSPRLETEGRHGRRR